MKISITLADFRSRREYSEEISIRDAEGFTPEEARALIARVMDAATKAAKASPSTPPQEIA